MKKLSFSLAPLTAIVLIFAACQQEAQLKKQIIPMNSVEDVLTNLSPAVEEFEINANEEVLLEADQGTAIFIPANAFQFEDGSSPKGKISLEIKECYSLSDIIGENLHTRSGNQILETGGMVYLNASADGKPLQVKDQKALVLGFPKAGKEEEMDLFYRLDPNDSLSTWVPDYEMYKAEAKLRSRSDSTATYNEDSIPAPIELTPDLYDLKFGGPEMYCSYIHDLHFVNDNRNLMEYVYDLNSILDTLERPVDATEGFIGFQFNIDDKGKIVDLSSFDFGPINENEFATQLLLNHLKSAPAIQDTVHREIKNTNYLYCFGVFFGFNINKDRFKAKFRDQFAAYQDKAIQQLDKTALNYYLFSATRMGWINCDRFWETEEEKIDFMVNTPASDDVQLQLVFQDINSIMNGTRENDQTVFKNLPIGRKVKVIGISYANGKPTLATAETTISKDPFDLSAFREFSLNELENELNGVN